MTALGILWLALFPFWQAGSYSHITRAKWIGMLILTGVSVIAAAGLMVLRMRRREKLCLGWPQMAGLAYFALVGLSAVFGSWADHRGESGALTVLLGAYRYEGLVTQMCYGAIFLSMSVARVRLRPLLHAASAGLLVYGGMVALQYAGVNVLGLFPPGTSIMTNYEFQGPIGNIDMVVGYVSLVMAGTLGGFVWLPGRRTRPEWLWLAAGLTGALMLLCMEVQCGLIMLLGLLFLLGLLSLRCPDCRWRGIAVLAGVLMMVSVRLSLTLPWLDGTAQVGLRLTAARCVPLLAGLLLIPAAVGLKRRPGRPLPIRAVAVAGVAMVVAGLAALYGLPFAEGSGLWEIQEILYGRLQDSFGSERIGVWRLTLEMCRGDLLWGTGPDAFLPAMDHYLWQTGQSLVQRFDNPHNLFLGVLVNSGLPALGLYVTLTLGIPGYAALRAEEDRETLPLALAAVCYVIQGMFTFSICLVTPMFWATLGMLAGQLNERMRSDESDDTELCVPAAGVDGHQAVAAGADCHRPAGGAAGAGDGYGGEPAV